jgi:polar amino acid transport system substrate-binding protein
MLPVQAHPNRKKLVKSFGYGIVLLALIALVLPGCISGPRPPSAPEPPEPSGTLLQSEIRVGISPGYMPLVYRDPTFGLIGVEVDFARQLGNRLGKTVVFVEMAFSELVPALLDRRIDIIMSGMSITQERAELVNFTNPYARIGQMVLVRAADRSAFPNVQSFSKVTSSIGFVQQTTGEVAATAFFTKATFAPQPSVEEGIAALRKGEIDVFIHDAPTVWRIASSSQEKELEGLYWPLTKEPLAWAVRKDDKSFLFALNRQLSQWDVDGSLNRTLSHWVPLRIWSGGIR